MGNFHRQLRSISLNSLCISSGLKSETALSLANLPSSLLNFGLLNRSIIFSDKSFASDALTRIPAPPNTSDIGSMLFEMQGQPHAMASSNVIPNPSSNDGSTK